MKGAMRLACSVSILIISHNRSHFIRRFAGALEDMNFGGNLIVCESSSPENLQQSKEAISEIKPGYKVTHLHIPKEKGETISNSMNNCFKAGAACIDTKYGMLSCDDDIPVPLILQKFEEFLDMSPDYNGVNGELVWYDVNSELQKNESNKAAKKLFGLWAPQNATGRRNGINETFSIEGEFATDRLTEYLDRFFHTMFTLVRAETLNFIVPENANQITFPHFCADYNWMFAIALAGKIKHFDSPQVIRQFHGKNLGIKDENHPFPTYLEAMLESSWSEDANKFVNNLAGLLVEFDRIDPEIAYRHALSAFRILNIKRLEINTKKESRLSGVLKKFSILKYKFCWISHCKIYLSSVSSFSKFPLELEHD